MRGRIHTAPRSYYRQLLTFIQLFSVALVALVAACAAAPLHSTYALENIVELAQHTHQLSTLVTAVVAANLTGPLSGPG